MKKIILITTIILSLCINIYSQDVRPVIINASFNKVSFEEFALILKQENGVDIYFKPEWVQDIIIDVYVDTLTVSEVLSSILESHSLHYVKRGNRQFFLTGKQKVDPFKIVLPNSEMNPGDSLNALISKRYFVTAQYEKLIKKVVIGDRNTSNNSILSILSGRISSLSNGEPVIGATVIIEGTNNGVISNSNGAYSLMVETGSNITLAVSCLGMEPESYLVEVNSSGNLNIEMTEKLIDIQEVVVRSGKHDNVRGMQMGFQKIEMKEMKSIPMVLGERDILKIANMMPGVQSVGEGSAGMNVRGSTSDQNLFLINEVPVLNTGHLFGFFSAFNPDMISDFNLYKSNFPVEYGGRLASVFEISTRKGNKKEFGARGGISPVTTSLMVEAPIVIDKSSVILGARSTYSDWILNRMDDPDIRNSNASFYDLMGAVHLLNKDHSSWQIFGYYSKDKFTLAQLNDYSYENLGTSIIYDRNIREKWKMKVAAVLSNYSNYHTNREKDFKAYEHQFEVGSKELKINFSGFPWLNQRVGFGADVILHSLDHGSFEPFGPNSLIATNDFGQEKGLEYAIFAFDEFSITDKLTIYAGLRYSFFNYMGPKSIYQYEENQPYEIEHIVDTLNFTKGETISQYSGPEYRLSFNYKINRDFSIKFSYNRMRQYMFMLSNTVSVAPTDRWKLVDSYVSPPVSDQISLGLYKNINTSALETSAEIYIKDGKNIVEYKDGADLTSNPDFETLILQGNQNSYGAEFMIKRNAGRFTGWISYAWSRTIVTVNGEEEWNKINKGLSYPANYDKPHAFNFVGNIKLSRRLSIASNIVYNSGRPITHPTSIFYVDGLQAVNYSLRNEYRIPNYFRIDASINFEGNLLKEKVAHGTWAISIYNLTGRNNAYSVYFKNENKNIKGYKQSIYGVPIFTVSYNIKLGNYAVE